MQRNCCLYLKILKALLISPLPGHQPFHEYVNQCINIIKIVTSASCCVLCTCKYKKMEEVNQTCIRQGYILGHLDFPSYSYRCRQSLADTTIVAVTSQYRMLIIILSRWKRMVCGNFRKLLHETDHC